MFQPVTFPWNLPHDRNNRSVAQYHDSVHLALHHIHGPLGDQTPALDLLPSIPETGHKPGIGVLDLYKLNVSIPLPGEEDHVGVGVVEGDQDTRGDVQGEYVLRGREVSNISEDQFASPVLAEAGGHDPVLADPDDLAILHPVVTRGVRDEGGGGAWIQDPKNSIFALGREETTLLLPGAALDLEKDLLKGLYTYFKATLN